MTAKAASAVAALAEVRRLPLGRITIDQARRVARRIVHDEPAVPKVGVAAFGSYI